MSSGLIWNCSAASQPAPVTLGEFLVGVHPALGAEDASEGDAEVVCGGLHHEPLSEACWAEVAG